MALDDNAHRPSHLVRGDDLYIFASVTDAEAYLEPVDVEPGERGYDAEGRLLQVLVRGQVRRGRFTVDQIGARVEIAPAEEFPGHAEELRAVLVHWLRGAERAPDLDGSLAELVDRARKHVIHCPRISGVIGWLKAVLGLGAAILLYLLALWWFVAR